MEIVVGELFPAQAPVEFTEKVWGVMLLQVDVIGGFQQVIYAQYDVPGIEQAAPPETGDRARFVPQVM